MLAQLRSKFRADIARKTMRKTCIILDIVVSLSCAGYIAFGAVFTLQPGPKTYYNQFVGILLATCLIFTCFQHALLTLSITKFYDRPVKHVLMWIYWVTIAISGLICGVGYSIALKPECLTFGFVTCIVAKIAWCQLTRTKCRASSRSPHIAVDDAEEPSRGSISRSSSTRRAPTPFKHPALPDTPESSRIVQVSSAYSKVGVSQYRQIMCKASSAELVTAAVPGYDKRKLTKALRIINRTLKVIHWAITVLNAAGAIILALQNRYSNPGTRVLIALPDGLHRTVNYNCTVPTPQNASIPTVWFEADVSHSVVDFLGVQTYLATQHNIFSCSYDPPNVGWSDPLPAWYTDYTTYLPSLLTALGQQNQRRVYAGWGGGLELSLQHAIADQTHAIGVIDLDASPDGIEFFDAQRANNWTDAQRLAYRHSQLNERASLTRTLLTLGIGWGLTPVFVPGDSSAYFDLSLYPRYHAQVLKDAFWASQYFSILQEAAAPAEDPYLNSTVLPAGMKMGAIMTENPMPGNEASNEFYKSTNLDMVERMSSGKADVQWCGGNCTLSFPVDMAEWTAGVVAGMVESMI